MGPHKLGRAFAGKRVLDWQAASQRDVCAHPLSTGVDQEGTKDRLTDHKKQHDTVLLRAEQAAHGPMWRIHPEGILRLSWDGFAVLQIFLLVLYVPFLVAYFSECSCNYFTYGSQRHPGETRFLRTPYSKGWQTFAIITDYFFLVDIPLNLMTGLERGQHQPIDYSLQHIWQDYLLGWFWVDLAACLPLQCMLVSWAPHVTWWNLGYAIGLLRVLTISRRCRGSVYRWLDRIPWLGQEVSAAARRIFSISVWILVGCHYFSCLDWWIIRLQGPTSITWPLPNQNNVAETTPMQQWLWGMFNSISATTLVTYGGYPPTLWGEAILWVVMPIILAAMFLVVSGFIAAYICFNTSRRSSFKANMDGVLAAVRSRALPAALSSTIIEYFATKYNLQGSARGPKALEQLPYSMRLELALHSVHPYLHHMPLFESYPGLLRHTAMLVQSSVAVAGELVIRQGWPATQMLILQEGALAVHHNDALIEILQAGDTVGEDALLVAPSDELLQQEAQFSFRDLSAYADCFPSLVTVRAVCNCRLLILEQSIFRRMLGDHLPALERLKQMGLRLQISSVTCCRAPTSRASDEAWPALGLHAVLTSSKCWRTVRGAARHAKALRESGMQPQDFTKSVMTPSSIRGLVSMDPFASSVNVSRAADDRTSSATIAARSRAHRPSILKAFPGYKP